MGRLFWKFFLAFWLALLVAGATVGTVVWFHKLERDEYPRELAVGPAAELLVKSATATLEYGGLPALRQLIETMRDDPIVSLYAVDEGGRELLGRAYPRAALERARTLADSSVHPPVASTLKAADGHVYLFFAAEAEGRRVQVPGGAETGRQRHTGPAGPSESPTPLLPILYGLFASLAFSALLAWYLAKPIRRLREALGAAAAGDLEVRVAPGLGRRRDELADLGRDFDHMAGRLRDLMEAQRRLLHDVSHEIRSPLARLQAAIGLARQQPEKREASLDRIERECMRLDELVGELLTLSRLEAGMADTRRERIDLVELVGMVAEDARFEAETQGRRVQFTASGPALVRCGAELLHRAVENVVRNALKFSPDQGEVEIQVREAMPGRVAVVVADRGPGVPEAHLAAIFDPFYRVDGGLGGAGFGLGLAIARRAVEAHGGGIRASNREGGGLEIVMELPTDDSEDARRVPD